MSDVSEMNDAELADLYVEARDELADRDQIEVGRPDLDQAIQETAKNLGDKQERSRSMSAKAVKLQRLQNRTNANAHPKGDSDE